ncbi:MAG TPA: FtsX-like permease family protein [Chitinispirillaceae bacterium]|nr:FtsX-like permease family protein [Chitinispirillaceae bacterium]
MVTGIAWKNIWRNKTRSLIIISAIAIGLCCSLLSSSISFAMGEQMIQSAIRTRLSDIQIHNPKFTKDKNIHFFIANAADIVNQIEKNPKLVAASKRVTINAMVSSPASAAGVLVLGIDPGEEKSISNINNSISKGNYFQTDLRYPVVLGEKLASTLDVQLGSKIVLTFQDISGELTGGAFRIAGIFRTVSSEFDRSNVFVLASDLWDLLQTDTLYTEIAVLLNRGANVDSAAQSIRKIVPDMKVDTWRTLAPELSYIEETTSVSLFIFMGVILMALTFGTTNSMLMAVLERRRELGMLMAVGMSGKSIFLMIVLETFFLSLTGALAGLAFTLIFLILLSCTGIDLSYFAKGLSEYGIAEILFPYLPGFMFAAVTIMVIITAIISALFPALKALRLRPAQVLRM